MNVFLKKKKENKNGGSCLNLYKLQMRYGTISSSTLSDVPIWHYLASYWDCPSRGCTEGVQAAGKPSRC